MADKITFNDKGHVLPYGTREIQVWDLDINEIKAVVNSNADFLQGVEGGYQGALLIADTPTFDGYYLAGESGTYTNAGGLVVDLTLGITFINVSSTQTVFTKTVIPASIIPIGTVESGNIYAVSGGNVYDSLYDLRIITETSAQEEVTSLTSNYIDSLGVLVSNANWETSNIIDVYEGQKITYYGDTTQGGAAYPLMGYDAAGVFVQSLLPNFTDYTLGVDVIIPVGVFKVYACSSISSLVPLSVIASFVKIISNEDIVIADSDIEVPNSRSLISYVKDEVLTSKNSTANLLNFANGSSGTIYGTWETPLTGDLILDTPTALEGGCVAVIWEGSTLPNITGGIIQNVNGEIISTGVYTIYFNYLQGRYSMNIIKGVVDNSFFTTFTLADINKVSDSLYQSTADYDTAFAVSVASFSGDFIYSTDVSNTDVSGVMIGIGFGASLVPYTSWAYMINLQSSAPNNIRYGSTVLGLSLVNSGLTANFLSGDKLTMVRIGSNLKAYYNYDLIFDFGTISTADVFLRFSNNILPLPSSPSIRNVKIELI